jgi:hypothetical protein
MTMNKRIAKVGQGTVVATDTTVQINDLECGHMVPGHFKLGQEVECRECGRRAIQQVILYILAAIGALTLVLMLGIYGYGV